MRRLVLFELNEVPYRIVDMFCAARPASCLARLLPRCSQYETIATDRGRLSPWITWPTLHRGVNNEQHGIGHLGETLGDVDARYPPLWQLLTRHGVRAGVFGPLHSYPVPESLDNYAFYLPDTFAPSATCHPASLSLFQEFNLQMVRASARNVAGGVALGPAARLAVRAPALGLRASTALDVGAQLIAERRQPWKRVRRRSYQAVLAFDLFEKLLSKQRPAFANFFTNHVASSMHRYWAARFPEDYDRLDYDEKYFVTYRDEIEFAMAKFDRMFERLVQRAQKDPDLVVAVVTSMGQAASQGESTRDQVYIRNVSKLLTRLGLQSGDWSHRMAMDPDVAVQVSQDKVAHLRDGLERLRVHGAPIWAHFKPDGFVNLSIGLTNVGDKPRIATLGDQEVRFEEIGLEVVAIEDQAGEAGYHVPEGVLLIYDRRDRTPSAERQKVPTTAIAPWILRSFGIEAPNYMQDARSALPTLAAR